MDHGITVDEINAQFEISKAYFALPQEVKGRISHDIRTNNGWEYKVSQQLFAQKQISFLVCTKPAAYTGSVSNSPQYWNDRSERVFLVPAQLSMAYR